MIYLIGSLRNPLVPKVATHLREEGLDVFDDWYASGPEADDKWREYEQQRGRSYREALRSPFARNAFEFDKTHLSAASAVVLILPAGKSAHMELGWSIGRGTPSFILLDSPDRWDMMYQFATDVFESTDVLVAALRIVEGR